MDPRNGEILAMVSSPSYDDNVIGDPSRDEELNKLLNDDTNMPMFRARSRASTRPARCSSSSSARRRSRSMWRRRTP